MAIDELDDYSVPPRKWLDKKQYVRVDPTTGLPQLVRVEPVITDTGEFVPEHVNVFVDDTVMVMDRDAADDYIINTGCVPLEITAQWKHQKVN